MSRRVSLVDGKVRYEDLDPDREPTFQDRFKAALRDVRREGVKVKQNVRGCCRSCISYDHEAKLGIVDAELESIVWTYGGQGSAYRWVDGFPYYYPSGGWRSDDGARVERIYWNHSGPGTVAAAALAKAMIAHGIEVEWDGSEYQCPQVIVPQDSVQDNS